MIAEEDYRDMQETLYLLAIPGMRESIIKAKAEPLSECAKTLDW